MTRHLGCAEYEIDVLAVQGKSLQSSVRAISHDQHWRFATGIDAETVRTIELAGALSQAAEGANKFGLLVVLVNVTGTVAVTDVDVTARGSGHVGWFVANRSPVFGLIGGRFRRIAQSENLNSGLHRR